MKAPFFSRFPTRHADSLLESMASYTRFVGRTKMVLGIMVIGMITLVVAIPLINGEDGGIRIALSGGESNEPASPRMINPQFRGFDAQDQPFTVTADYALQKDENNVVLSNMNADVTLKGGKWLSLTAKDGNLNMVEKSFIASGAVNVFYDDGYEFTTDKLRVNIDEKKAYCDTPVEGQGPMGAIKAQGFIASQEKGTILFHGPVQLTVYPKGQS